MNISNFRGGCRYTPPPATGLHIHAVPHCEGYRLFLNPVLCPSVFTIVPLLMESQNPLMCPSFLDHWGWHVYGSSGQGLATHGIMIIIMPSYFEFLYMHYSLIVVVLYVWFKMRFLLLLVVIVKWISCTIVLKHIHLLQVSL